MLNVTLFRVSSKQDVRIKELFEYLSNAYCKSKNQKNGSGENKEVNKELKEKEMPQKTNNVVKEAKEVKLGEIKKENKKKYEEKNRISNDLVAENEKQNEIIRKNLNDDKKKKKDCIIF